MSLIGPSLADSFVRPGHEARRTVPHGARHPDGGNRHRCLKGAFIIRNPDGALFTVSDTKGGDLIQRTQVD